MDTMSSDNDTNCDIIPPLCWESETEYIAYMYIHMPVSIMGIITNCLNLLVLHQRPFRVRVTAFTLLRGMAVADLLACTCIFPIGFCRCLEPTDNSWETYVQQFYEIYIYLPISNWFGCVSIYLTTVVSLERYMSVGYALKAKRLWTTSKARLIILCLYIGGLIINIPYFFLRKIEDTAPPGYTEWGMSSGASVYSWWRMVFIKTIPLILVACLNGFLVMAIWKSNKRHQAMMKPTAATYPQVVARQQLQMRATAMVVSISLVYLACHFIEPFSHSGIWSSIFGKCSLYSKNHRIMLVTTNIIETFSYASNFFFYCLFNRQFTNVLKNMFRCNNNRVKDMGNTITVNSVVGVD